jgi:hypothetical protein
MAGSDPRQTGLFNAAWTLGYIARFVAGAAQRVAVSAPIGDFGILGNPVFHVIAGCARLRGAPLHAVRTSRERDVLALRAGPELWLANLTAAPVCIAVPQEFQGNAARMLDSACGPDWTAMRDLPAPGADITLLPFAVAALRAAT